MESNVQIVVVINKIDVYALREHFSLGDNKVLAFQKLLIEKSLLNRG